MHRSREAPAGCELAVHHALLRTHDSKFGREQKDSIPACPAGQGWRRIIKLSCHLHVHQHKYPRRKDHPALRQAGVFPTRGDVRFAVQRIVTGLQACAGGPDDEAGEGPGDKVRQEAAAGDGILALVSGGGLGADAERSHECQGDRCDETDGGLTRACIVNIDWLWEESGGDLKDKVEKERKAGNGVQHMIS